MLTIDGAMGEGGGQILRTSLALSLLTGTPFELRNIRALRKVPGLRRQHLAAVRAAADVGRAKVEGAEPGSRRLVFKPAAIEPGAYTFSIGTAGSATLVLQTVLPPLLRAAGPSILTLEGGTHNPLAPPFDFIERAFLPLVARMGPKVSARLDRRGFYPAGGGRVVVEISPGPLSGLELLERGELRAVRATAIVARLSTAIAERELEVLGEALGTRDLRAVEDHDSLGPGNVVLVDLESEHATEVVAAFGEKGLPAEIVARRAAEKARRYLDSGVPVGEHLADQLLLPLALAGRGAFRTGPLSPHARTNLAVIESFLGPSFRVSEGPAVTVEASSGGR